jgi:hypothetical protein
MTIILFLCSVAATRAGWRWKHYLQNVDTCRFIWRHIPYVVCLETPCVIQSWHTLHGSVLKHLLDFNKQAYTRTDLTFKFSCLKTEAVSLSSNFRWMRLVFLVLDSISTDGITEQHNMKWNLGTDGADKCGIEYNADVIISISSRTMEIISHIKFTPVNSLSILASVPNKLITPLLVPSPQPPPKWHVAAFVCSSWQSPFSPLTDYPLVLLYL